MRLRLGLLIALSFGTAFAALAGAPLRV